MDEASSSHYIQGVISLSKGKRKTKVFCVTDVSLDMKRNFELYVGLLFVKLLQC